MTNYTKKQPQITFPKIVKKQGMIVPYLRGEYQVEKQVDSDNPKRVTTRLRRKSVYDEMLNRGSITKEQRDYAEKYAILCEKALGRTGDLYAKMNFMRDGVGCSWEPSAAQHEAYEKLFKLWNEIGRYHKEILNMIVLGNMSTKDISQAMKLNLHYTMGQVLSTFILLEEAFENVFVK
ncbi:unnamed protein product [Commensalibacter communis]|uniref:Uncharacterized protein n=1 Tax=Commensalibacter communis TaxID=2972786 RepID=A0A9W4TR64_9PROT|nr:hypothetical protein [Commensalibacter communis]CAI3952374.1 unnamed protein product [Commensalibacter communis]CAI3955724.1 unnamed protein product [Commensalibacter communis]CAI3956022.1 unnamed protein product [Commensalibacter communis]CAI3956492.1 unnamed protein product [Commensalibacter communis]CAI3958684.1 unnamed protein product [Commensalibacter communis]